MKIQVLLICLSILSAPLLYGQNNSTDAIKLKIGAEFIDLMADSLNSLDSSDVWPHWLFDPNLDYRFSSYYFSFHQLSSTRKLVLDKVVNKKSLLLVLENQNPKLNAISDTTNSIVNRIVFPMPFSSFSTRELVQYRLDELGKSE